MVEITLALLSIALGESLFFKSQSSGKVIEFSKVMAGKSACFKWRVVNSEQWHRTSKAAMVEMLQGDYKLKSVEYVSEQEFLKDLQETINSNQWLVYEWADLGKLKMKRGELDCEGVDITFNGDVENVDHGKLNAVLRDRGFFSQVRKPSFEELTKQNKGVPFYFKAAVAGEDLKAYVKENGAVFKRLPLSVSVNYLSGLFNCGKSFIFSAENLLNHRHIMVEKIEGEIKVTGKKTSLTGQELEPFVDTELSLSDAAAFIYHSATNYYVGKFK